MRSLPSALALVGVLTCHGALGLLPAARAEAPNPLAAPRQASASTQTQAEYFEREVRPILSAACFKCHALGDRSKGKLQIDSLAGLLRGGKRGPAVVPGDSEHSLLVRAIRHDPELGLKMPPDQPLSKDRVAKLARWIDQGAVWPSAPPLKSEDEDSAPWSFQPPRDPPIPQVQETAWPKAPIDFFILAELEKQGLSPARPADKAALLRRVTFDLIGLPPTLEELDAFVADDSADAFAKVVDRLLDSPHYGERWARHWLDLVRFSETNGLDFDTEKPGAYHYRDYVIEAFNEDLPFDQFIREHLAGDVLSDPRPSRDGSRVSSPIATAFLWLGEMLEEDNDPREEAANEVENQVDAIGKCFLGMTMACARCHDHKFDPILQTDYEAIAAALIRSSNVVACLDTPARTSQIESQLAAIDQKQREIRRLRGPLAAQEARRYEAMLLQAERMADYLCAARELFSHGVEPTDADVAQLAGRQLLQSQRLRRWWAALEEASGMRNAPLYPWAALASFPRDRFANRARALQRFIVRNEMADRLDDAGVARPASAPATTQFPLAGFDQDDFDGWTSIGPAFGAAPARWPAGWQTAGDRGFASSLRGSDRLTGQLVSPRLKIEKPYLNLSISGGTRAEAIDVHLVMLHHAVPVMLVDRYVSGDGHPGWSRKTMEVSRYMGREAVVVLSDRGIGSHLMVDRLWFSDTADDVIAFPPARANGVILSWLADSSIRYPEDLARRYQEAIVGLLRQRRDELQRYARLAEADPDVADVIPPRVPSADADQESLACWIERHLDLVADTEKANSWDTDVETADTADRIARLEAEKKALEQALPQSTLALVASDHPRLNLTRQFPNADSAELPGIGESFFAALGAPKSDPAASGHGRLALAEWIASPGNPLTARVLVNRVWQHHFGRGLVATPDNFGKLGEPPTHPALLDWLATRFIESGWSIKKLHRLMLLSSTYQQSSRPSAQALAKDPANRWLHCMPLRRIEAECIRDAILAVAGNLNRQVFGPSVPLYIGPQMRGDDLPKVSGPRDGNCRRSIYLMVRHNHPTPLLNIFDFPTPDRCTGRRENSSVPAQALALMNDPFIRDEAAIWARRLLALDIDDQRRVERMYREAFGRLPDAAEQDRARDFLMRETARYEAIAAFSPKARAEAWADLCHLMYNVSEFVYVP